MKILFFSLLPLICSAYKVALLAADVSDSQKPQLTMPQYSTVMPQPATVMPQPATVMPQPATVMPQPATVMPQPATVLFNYRVASTLADGGHDVTVVFIASYRDRDLSMMRIPKNVKTHFVDANIGHTKDEIDEQWADLMYEDFAEGDPRTKAMMMSFLGVLTGTYTVNNREFINWLEGQKFDLAFANAYHMCSVGLIHKAKIPSWIWLDSGLLKEFVARAVGVPIFPSITTPIHFNMADELSLSERWESLKGHYYGKQGWDKLIIEVENKYFQEAFGPSFPHLNDIAKKCPLVMVNDNDLYGLPRPTLAKVVNIGGLGAKLKDAKPLPEKFASIAEKGKGVVLISLGSVARLHMAPESWKNAFLGAFKRLPDYQFVVRYDGHDLDDKLPPNVFFSKWIPQADLLQHKNTKAFLTHGGYNSMQETIGAGVPTVMIGLFGDQQKNSQVAKKHGFAEVLSKGNFTENAVYEALEKVLNNPKYSEKAQRLSKMVNNQPVPPETLLVRWAEFVAEFKELENMEPASQKLDFLQFYSLDILLSLLLIAIFGSLLALYILRVIYCFIFRRDSKSKKE